MTALASRLLTLKALAVAMVRDAVPATKSAQTCFVPKYQMDALAALIGDIDAAAAALSVPEGDIETLESLCLLAFSEEDGYGYEGRAKFGTFRDGFFACVRKLKLSAPAALSVRVPEGDMARALEWVREVAKYPGNRPTEILAAIEEAIAAYDPERAGAQSGRAVMAALTREQREDDALADTQRAIIEAAEQRGYERGKAEWRQQVKDAWDNLSIGKVDKPKDTGRFA